MDEQKICPIMSRPAPYIYSIGHSSVTNFGLQKLPSEQNEGKTGYELMKIPCLQSECQAWTEPCRPGKCEDCTHYDPDDPEDCIGKTGYCKLIERLCESNSDY
jgi:hypothetical protein